MAKELTSEVSELLEAGEAQVQLAEKEKFIRRRKLEKQYDDIVQNEAEVERLSKIDIFQVSTEYLEKMDEQHEMTIASMKDRMPFVNKILTELVPFNYPNLILLGAKTGHGKTSFTSASLRALLRDKRNTLVLSNEEMAVNYYNRVICLHKDWDVNKIKDFTKEQHEELRKLRALMYRSRRLTVIDPDFDSMKDATRTIEGIKFLLDKVYEAQEAHPEKKCAYDAIYLDYYQNCGSSKLDPRKRRHEVLEDLSKYLDMMYKKIKAPIVVLSQIKPEAKDESDFEFRIKESKSIFVPSTFALELAPDKNRSMTKCICHKHRWSSRAGEGVDLGFDRGHFVEYSMEFQQKIAERNERKEHAATMQKALRNIDDKKG